MPKALKEKLTESFTSVIPVALIVIVLSFTPLAGFTAGELIIFGISTVCMIAGITLFNLGADIAMTPMGSHVGGGLTRTRRLGILLPVAFFLGLLITVAEPDLSVLAGQVSSIMNGTALIFCVGAGVGLFLLIGVLKIIFRHDLTSLLFYFYMILFCLCAFLAESGRAGLMPLSFDSGGVTTGPVTVPFIMALGVGIASAVGGDRSGENSFGLIALCSVGPILAVMLLSLFSSGELAYTLPDYSMTDSFGEAMKELLSVSLDVLKALGLIVIFFFALNFTMLHLSAKELKRMLAGIVYTFAGLVIFLTAANVGFMPIGFSLGRQIASNGPVATVIFGTVLGALVVLAEPAVHVLNRQVEQITNEQVTGTQMMLALSIGVGASIGLSCIRIIFNFSILYYLIPGYLISLGLSFFVPRIYTAIAFDSGGVASGPLTSSFILPLIIGVCVTFRGESDVLSLAFGVVAMVAMIPLITIQVLGFRAIVSAKLRRRITMRRILDADDEQIIYFSVKYSGKGDSGQQ